MKWFGRSTPSRAATRRGPPRATHVRRTRLGFRAARQLRAASSPGVARTEAPLGVRTAAWSLRVHRRPRPPIPAGPSPALPQSRAPVEVWDVAPASAAAGVQLEAAVPIYGAVPCPGRSRPHTPAPPERRR
jgi:hypothetical protein